MSTAREDILGAIRRALGRGPVAEPERAELEARLAKHPRNLVPGRAEGSPAELVTRFVEEASAVDVSVARVADFERIPDAIADYLAKENLPARIRVAPEAALKNVPWSRRPVLAVSYGPSEGADEVGVCAAFAGIAESGTLMLLSGPERPTTLNFLPDTHIVVLRASEIVGAYEDAWDRLRCMPMPRTVNLVTGPSRTGDIEQTIFVGAHGPRRLHVVLVEDLDEG